MVTVARPLARAKFSWLRPCALRIRASACLENTTGTPEYVRLFLSYHTTSIESQVGYDGKLTHRIV